MWNGRASLRYHCRGYISPLKFIRRWLAGDVLLKELLTHVGIMRSSVCMAYIKSKYYRQYKEAVGPRRVPDSKKKALSLQVQFPSLDHTGQHSACKLCKHHQKVLGSLPEAYKTAIRQFDRSGTVTKPQQTQVGNTTIEAYYRENHMGQQNLNIKIFEVQYTIPTLEKSAASEESTAQALRTEKMYKAKVPTSKSQRLNPLAEKFTPRPYYYSKLTFLNERSRVRINYSEESQKAVLDQLAAHSLHRGRALSSSCKRTSFALDKNVVITGRTEITKISFVSAGTVLIR